MTDTTTPAPTYAQESLRAGQLAAGTQLLLDTTELRGPLDLAGLRALPTEAEGERDRCAALAERDARRAEAGQAPGTTCTCGHSDTAHSRKLTADGRLPCTRTDCLCDDLTFA
ncbi:hypothetical protein [Streptomyces sp. MS2.AVA.5]|uniref:Uncharacterized protein n=1 Tax=Streptomyces achmelvichensis TaxID=3134111 RepID=A0ACC6Q8X4_9ACTN